MSSTISMLAVRIIYIKFLSKFKLNMLGRLFFIESSVPTTSTTVARNKSPTIANKTTSDAVTFVFSGAVLELCFAASLSFFVSIISPKMHANP